MSVIPVMHCFDDRYCAPASVAFLSMLEHGSKDCFYRLYVLNSDITLAHQEMLREVVSRFDNASLEFRSVDDSVARQLFDSLETKGHYSKEIVYKLLAPRLFPEYTRLVVTDVDVLYCDDISREYCAFAEDKVNWIAGIPWDALPCTWVKNALENCYANDFTADETARFLSGIGGGYLLLNLDLMRQYSVSETMIELFRKNLLRIKQAEQDVINIACAGHIRRLEQRNMVCTYYYDRLLEHEKPLWRSALSHPVQLHYASSTKPWTSPGSTQAHLWWGYLSRTPFFYEVASKFDLDEKKSICKLGGLRVAKIWHTGSLNKVCLVNSIKTQIQAL